jgi:hypothetical protein
MLHTPLHVIFEMVTLCDALMPRMEAFATTSEYPEDLADIGFEHEGTHIMIPIMSTCMRFPVDPYKEYGRSNVLMWILRAKRYLAQESKESP